MKYDVTVTRFTRKVYRVESDNPAAAAGKAMKMDREGDLPNRVIEDDMDVPYEPEEIEE